MIVHQFYEKGLHILNCKYSSSIEVRLGVVACCFPQMQISRAKINCSLQILEVISEPLLLT